MRTVEFFLLRAADIIFDEPAVLISLASYKLKKEL